MSLGHDGIDFSPCANEEVIAIADGEVFYINQTDGDEYSGAGRVLTLDHAVGPEQYRVVYRYAHLRNVRVTRGQKVKRGQVLGEMWIPSDPASTWETHVHLELLDDSRAIDDQDPLPTLGGCQSQAKPGQLIFPVRC